MFRRVLIPLDASEESERIVHQIDIVLPPGLREVLLVHVAQPTSPLEGRTAFAVERGILERKERLDGLVRRLAEVGLKARALLRRGKPVEQIVRTAIEEGADLVAMIKRRTGLIGRLLGSVADGVVRHSPVPVLMVRGESLWHRGARAVAPRRILVPLDGSERAFRILPAVAKLARGFGSRITLLYVGRSNDPEGVLPYEHLDRPSVAFVERRMDAWVRRLRKMGAHAGLATVLGEPTEQILRVQREQEFDLVAMTTHGRTGLQRWILGSVTEAVLEAADVPLLVLRNVHIRPGTYAARRRPVEVP